MKAGQPVVMRRTVVPITTPEGVVLPFHVAGAGERLGAFVADMLLLAVLLLLLLVLVALAAPGLGGWLGALVLLAIFALMNGWFLFFELRPGAASPGKRWAGLRVIDRHGGVLTVEAVVARNLMRNLELFVPLAVLLGAPVLWPDAPWWARLAAVGWLIAVAGMPSFNRLRLRAGDVVGGTLVVVAPKPTLLPELSNAAPARVAAEYEFTPEQLSVYGVFELQTLEEVLRRRSLGDAREAARAEAAVAEKIARKLRWGTVPPARAHDFLLAFYGALRARLESRMLLGKRKQDKHSRER
jgi:uncharacterized RDD family membrane protein YckC